MASPIGIGDALTIAKGVYDLYKFFKNAPEEIESAGLTVDETTVLLKLYENPISLPHYLKTEAGKPLVNVINSQLKALKKTLRQLKKILTYGKNVRNNLAKWWAFVAWHVKDIKALQQLLHQQNESIRSSFQDANQPGFNVDPALHVKIQYLTDQVKVMLQLQQQTAAKTDEKHVENALKSVDIKTYQSPNMDPQKRRRLMSELTSAGLSTQDAETTISVHQREARRILIQPKAATNHGSAGLAPGVNSSVKKSGSGSGKNDSNKKPSLVPKNNSNEKPSLVPKNSTNAGNGRLSPHPQAKSPSPDRRSPSPGGKSLGSKSPVGSGHKSPSPKPGGSGIASPPPPSSSPPSSSGKGQSSTANKSTGQPTQKLPIGQPKPPSISVPKTAPRSRCSILFVDHTHGVRAIMSHLYLELMRVWAANSGQPWLFHRVDSAGFMVKSRFRAEEGKLSPSEKLMSGGEPFSKNVLRALFPQPDFWTAGGDGDKPQEKQAVFDRLSARVKQGLTEFFVLNTHIVCFDVELKKSLEQLCNVVKKNMPQQLNYRTPKIIALTEAPFKSGETDVATVAQPLRFMLNRFLKENLGWTQPTIKIFAGPFRTQFVQLQQQADKEVVVGENGAEIRRLERETGCTMHVSFSSRGFGWLLAIVGKEERLAAAKKMVLEMIDDDE